MIKVGNIVRPKSTKGLWLADVAINGEHKQPRKNVCIFEGTGIVLEIQECIIDYDEWGRLDGFGEELNKLGKVKYRDCLVKCSAGIGWAGAGALEKCVLSW